MNLVIVKTTFPHVGAMSELEVIIPEDPKKNLKDFVREYLVEKLSVEKSVVESMLSKEDDELSDILDEYEINYSGDSLYLPETDNSDAVRYDIVKTYDINEQPVSIGIVKEAE